MGCCVLLYGVVCVCLCLIMLCVCAVCVFCVDVWFVCFVWHCLCTGVCVCALLCAWLCVCVIQCAEVYFVVVYLLVCVLKVCACV